MFQILTLIALPVYMHAWIINSESDRKDERESAKRGGGTENVILETNRDVKKMTGSAFNKIL